LLYHHPLMCACGVGETQQHTHTPPCHTGVGIRRNLRHSADSTERRLHQHPHPQHPHHRPARSDNEREHTQQPPRRASPPHSATSPSTGSSTSAAARFSTNAERRCGNCSSPTRREASCTPSTFPTTKSTAGRCVRLCRESWRSTDGRIVCDSLGSKCKPSSAVRWASSRCRHCRAGGASA